MRQCISDLSMRLQLGHILSLHCHLDDERDTTKFRKTFSKLEKSNTCVNFGATDLIFHHVSLPLADPGTQLPQTQYYRIQVSDFSIKAFFDVRPTCLYTTEQLLLG